MQLVASIRATHSAAHLDIIPCDLSDLHSVVDAAKAVLKLGAPLHVLMLNVSAVSPVSLVGYDQYREV